MAIKSKISIVTATRAEYGLLHWLMKRMRQSKVLTPEIVVTGAHLESEFGNTFQLIEKDGIRIYRKIKILEGEGRKGVGYAASNAVRGFIDYFTESRPSAVILLGDRYEILAIAQAAAISGTPVVHLHGGEISEGAQDDMFRHAITKLSCLHFTSNVQHKRRVIQLGETPSRVHVCGALGIENINHFRLLDRRELEKAYGIKFKQRIFLITFHPATLEKEAPKDQFGNLLNAILKFGDTTYIISKANADAGGSDINRMIESFRKKNTDCLAKDSFGQINYLSLMKIADLVIGNSSSGIIEAPSMLTATVNVGTRQKGRLSAKSVVSCGTTENEIKNAIDKALKIRELKKFKNPYDHGNSSQKIIATLEKTDFDKLLPKKFYDLK
jgi:GDP/UDP-N,N'-diacetylbacillosamine 2-epimerase (hydrolysing)